MRLPAGTTTGQAQILSLLLLELRRCLDNNPYIRDFITACEIPENELTNANFVINAAARPAAGHSRLYNRSFNEVSVLISSNTGGEEATNRQPRDIQLQLRSGGLTTVADTHRSYDALHFVLYHPFGIKL